MVSGKTVFTAFVLVAVLGFTSGAIGLQNEKAEIRRAEQARLDALKAAEEARKAAEAKRLADLNATWRKQATEEKDWRDVPDANGEIILQYRDLAEPSTCPTDTNCSYIEVNPKYSCVSLTLKVDWEGEGDKVLKTSTHTDTIVLSKQVFRMFVSISPRLKVKYYDPRVASCSERSF